MFTKLLIVLLFTCPVLACERGYYIISDFDDTIKNYKSDSTIGFVVEAIFKKKMNAGFDVLYNEMVNESSSGCKNGFSVLTASPNPMKGIIKSFFRKYSFPSYHLITRNIGEDTLDYKVSFLEAEATRIDSPFILIGDDTSKDPYAYEVFADSNPEKVVQVYIHRVEDHEEIPGQIRYLTAFDIALNEYLEGRLSKLAMKRVGEAVLASNDYQIIPKYAYCPASLEPISEEALERAILERIALICSLR